MTFDETIDWINNNTALIEDCNMEKTEALTYLIKHGVLTPLGNNQFILNDKVTIQESIQEQER